MIFPNVIIEQFCHSWNTNMRFGNDCCGNDRVVFFFFNDIWGKFIMQWWISWFVANSYSQVMHYRFSKINARDTRCFIRHSVMTWNLFTVNTNIYRIYFLNSYLGSTIIIFSCFNVSGFFASYLLISTSQ